MRQYFKFLLRIVDFSLVSLYLYYLPIVLESSALNGAFCTPHKPGDIGRFLVSGHI